MCRDCIKFVKGHFYIAQTSFVWGSYYESYGDNEELALNKWDSLSEEEKESEYTFIKYNYHPVNAKTGENVYSDSDCVTANGVSTSYRDCIWKEDTESV